MMDENEQDIFESPRDEEPTVFTGEIDELQEELVELENQISSNQL